jgi:hypothetical protein
MRGEGMGGGLWLWAVGQIREGMVFVLMFLCCNRVGENRTTAR